jgi:glucose-6-phosphate 1-dehydrogenase
MDDSTLYPCNFVIFGATGNLASIKLLPALYRLEMAGRLPESLDMIAFSRRDWNNDQWREHMEITLKDKLGDHFSDAIFKRFADRFSYLRGELHSEEDYKRLVEELGKPKMGVCSNVVFYLAIKPTEFGAVIHNRKRPHVERTASSSF